MKSLLTSLILLSICSFSHAQTTYYVPDDFSTIQLAIDGSLAGDTVIVRDGTYYENIDFDNNIHLKSENGFVTTIIDGSMPSGSQTQVVTFGDVDNTAKLQGFTITGGSNSNWNGGGLYISRTGSTPSPTIEDCKISNNSAIKGGGIWVGDGCSPEIIKCEISDNTASETGGGMMIQSGNGLVISESIISDNTATHGGGIYFEDTATATVSYSLFESNSAQYHAGAAYCANAKVNFNHSTFIKNTSPDSEALKLWNTGTPSIVSMTNCTVIGNGNDVFFLRSGGGGQGGDALTLTNCIVDTQRVTIEGNTSLEAYYSCLQGTQTQPWFNAGCIISDPLFVDSANGDCSLDLGSPCIDAGDPSSPLDPDGSRADMGVIFFSQGLFDDFEDGILDPSKWIANGPGTVTEENGQAVSRSRGHLTTVNEFSAELDGLRIAGEINYQGRSSLEPTFKIAWRSEIGANGTAAEALAGAKLYFGEPAPTQGFIRYVGISPYGGQAIDEAPFEMQAGESVRFLIKDFGGIITAEIENIDTGQTVSLSGTLPYTTSYGDHVKFYTREAPYNTTAGLEEIEIGPYHNNTDPMLAVNNLVSGQTAIVRVSDCTPRRPVMVMYSFAGGGPTNTPWGILSLTPPYYFFAPKIASSAGVAQFGKWVPNRFAGMDVWMQAIDWNSRAISNGLALTVQ